jgi:hypothetical protein
VSAGRGFTHCAQNKEALALLTYGPVGDPDSTDPFEWAQARMPEGWHVEGQELGAYFASRKSLDPSRKTEFRWGRTPEKLVEAVLNDGPSFWSWDDVRRASR